MYNATRTYIGILTADGEEFSSNPILFAARGTDYSREIH